MGFMPVPFCSLVWPAPGVVVLPPSRTGSRRRDERGQRLESADLIAVMVTSAFAGIVTALISSNSL
jgi:hypothetical protein